MANQQPDPATDHVHSDLATADHDHEDLAKAVHVHTDLATQIVDLNKRMVEDNQSLVKQLTELQAELAQTKTALSAAIEQAKSAAAAAQTTANDGVTRAKNAQTTADVGVQQAKNAQITANDGVARAKTAQTTTDKIRLSISQVFTWRQGEPDVRMLPARDTLACLTEVTGSFQGGGEMVRVFVRDGHWHLGGASQQAGVAAAAICVTITRT